MRSTGRRPFFAVLIGVVLVGGAETAVAQQPASGADAPRSGLLISTDSGYDTAESGSGDARAARRDSPGRLHAEWFRLASTRRSVVRFWTGVTAGVPDSDRTHAEAFAFAASTVLSRRTHFDFDARVNAARPLSFSRHTQIGFGTGTSVLTNATGRRLRLALSSSLARDWSRAWSARLEYNRPIEYLAGFAQPFLSDAVTVGANGRLGRR